MWRAGVKGWLYVPVRVLVDSTADIPPARARALGIEVVPLTVHFGDETYSDGVDLDGPGFYRKLTASSVTPTTSTPPPGIFEEVYRKLHAQGATGVLAMLALLTFRVRPLFWLFTLAFNLVGTADLLLNYYHAVQVGLPAQAGQLGVTYAIPIIYVPVLMITHFAAFYLLVRSQAKEPRILAGG